MSHFVVLVVLPAGSDVTHSTAKPLLNDILEPFNEQPDDAPGRLVECYCKDSRLSSAARRAADAELGPIDAVRDAHWSDPEVTSRQTALRTSEDEAKRERLGEEIDALWQARIAPRLAAEAAFKEEHRAQLGGFDPKCDECHGEGQRTTTYPEEKRDEGGALVAGPKWDWWVIGGRWTGLLDDYDPSKDLRNIRTCDLCHGTGKRQDMLHDADYIKNIGCNGCGGKGARVSWSLAPHEGDVGRVQQVLDDPKRLPYAVLTPDGRWCERGEMGWFGMASNEKSKSEWREQALALLAQYADHQCVVVDCHI